MSTTTEKTRILRLPNVLDRTALSRSTIYRLMATGAFPRSVALGSRSMGFFEKDIEGWLLSRAHKALTTAPAKGSATAAERNSPAVA